MVQRHQIVDGHQDCGRAGCTQQRPHDPARRGLGLPRAVRRCARALSHGERLGQHAGGGWGWLVARKGLTSARSVGLGKAYLRNVWPARRDRRDKEGRLVLPTFVIGLREGLEAALIVGIIAAFLGQQGRTDTLRLVWFGTAAAVAICVGVAIVLQVISSDLPQRQQEGLETVVGALAVCMVTYMIVFMRKHARSMKKDLQGAAASALATGSSRALVVMAFLAVLR